MKISTDNLGGNKESNYLYDLENPYFTDNSISHLDILDSIKPMVRFYVGCYVGSLYNVIRVDNITFRITDGNVEIVYEGLRYWWVKSSNKLARVESDKVVRLVDYRNDFLESKYSSL